MPTATKFKAIGAGNGFNNCISQNVTGYDHWTTLSGWSKTNQPLSQSAKLASIEESRRLTMLLFWNLSEVTGNSEITSVTNGNYSLSSSGIAVQPNNRICLSFLTKYAEQDIINNHSVRLGTYLTGFSAVAMYDNSVFIGYGLNGGFRSDAISISDYGNVFCHVRLNSYESIAANSRQDRAYVNLSINGNIFYFVSTATASTSTNFNVTFSVNRDANNLLAEGSATYNNVQRASATTQINSFNFYTY